MRLFRTLGQYAVQFGAVQKQIADRFISTT
jgi:hypothetical protein